MIDLCFSHANSLIGYFYLKKQFSIAFWFDLSYHCDYSFTLKFHSIRKKIDEDLLQSPPVEHEDGV